ncbi:MAG: glucose 1-dehydrogenase [Deltaproteobacteria bacterium]
MKAIAVFPGKPDSVHLRQVPKPSLDSIPDGRGVLVKILAVGLDGTDKEINAAEYGNPPPGEEFLILGHESFGVVEETGPAVTGLARGDFVAATVRRPGGSLYDRIGMQDMTTDDVYLERGINLRHGFLAEYVVESPEYLVRIPPGLQPVGVLTEPTSVIEKGIHQAYEIQRRMRIWRPRRAAVLGAGPVGLLAAMVLRLRGLSVCAFGRKQPPYRNADLLREIDACYHSTRDTSLTDAAKEHGPFDLIFEATGYSPLVFEAMNVLGKNGVLVLASVTGGDRTVEVPADRINLGFVLGNKVVVGTVNAGREHFEAGVKDLAHCEMQWPGWLEKILTHPVEGLDRFAEAMRLLEEGTDVIKVFVRVAETG